MPNQPTGKEPSASISATPPAFSAGQVLKDTAELPVNPLGAVSDEWNSLRQLVRSSATNHPEFSKVVGDKMDALQEMLFGGQSVGKPMGTSGGVANVAMTLGVPEAGSEMAGIEGAKAGETFVGKAGDAHVLVGKGGKILAGILRDPETNEITITPTKILNRVIPDNPEYAAKEAAAEREEEFNERAEALMHRGEEQERIDSKNASRLKEIEDSRQKELADTEKLRNQDAQARMRRGQQQERIDKQNEKSEPKIVNPNNAPKRIGNEGRAATWTNKRVMELARKGNREAIGQAILRGMELPENARYVMGDPDFESVTYNPRDVTLFTPEGTPLRQGGKLTQ